MAWLAHRGDRGELSSLAPYALAGSQSRTEEKELDHPGSSRVQNTARQAWGMAPSSRRRPRVLGREQTRANAEAEISSAGQVRSRPDRCGAERRLWVDLEHRLRA